MDSLIQFIIGSTPEETVIGFFVFVLVISGIFDWISVLLGGMKR